jgi:hypothetical protein
MWALATANDVQQSLHLLETPASSPIPFILESTGRSYLILRKPMIIRLNGLLYKLISLHVPDYLLSFLKSYSESRTFTVHLNDSASSSKPTTSCLPQGAVLPTTLFSICIFDMPSLPHTHLALYADDTALLPPSWYYLTLTQSRCNDLTQILHYVVTPIKHPQNWNNSIFQASPSPSGALFKSMTLLCPGPPQYAI